MQAEVYVFDYSKHPSKPTPDGLCKPDIRLMGHKTEARAVSHRLLSACLCDRRALVVVTDI